MKLRSIFLLGLMITSRAIAQNPLPSLLGRLKRTGQDTSRVLALTALVDIPGSLTPHSGIWNS